MASGLFDMLSDLAKDPALLASFRADPDNVMTTYGLSKAQKDALLESIKNGKHHHFFSAVSEEAEEQFADPDMFIC